MAHALAGKPELMSQLEEEAANDFDYSFSRLVKELAPAYAKDPDLREFCTNRSGVSLGPVTQKIIHFEPGSPSSANARPNPPS